MTLRPWGWIVSTACALALCAAACSSSSPGGAGGSSGGGASGAAGGATATAGASGAVGGSGGAVSCGDLPACVASLVAACPLASTSCAVSASVSGNTSTHKICFGNGVKVVNATTNDPNTGDSSYSISVTKNGVVCYTLDVPSSV